MSRKDYELIAAVLAKRVDNSDRKDIAYDLADALLADNPRFDRGLFLVAAGVWAKCDKCRKPARFITSRANACSDKHLPAWARKVRAAA